MRPGERLRTIRKRLGLAQNPFASAIGVQGSTISAIERGGSISHPTLESMKRTFHINPTWLMYGEGEPFLDGTTLEGVSELLGNDISIAQVTNQVTRNSQVTKPSLSSDANIEWYQQMIRDLTNTIREKDLFISQLLGSHILGKTIGNLEKGLESLMQTLFRPALGYQSGYRSLAA